MTQQALSRVQTTATVSCTVIIPRVPTPTLSTSHRSSFSEIAITSDTPGWRQGEGEEDEGERRGGEAESGFNS